MVDDVFDTGDVFVVFVVIGLISIFELPFTMLGDDSKVADGNRLKRYL